MSAAVSQAEIVTAEVVKSDALAPAFIGLEPSSARQVREAFVPALLQIEEWEAQAAGLTVTDESQTAKMKLAGVMRKELKKVRVGVEHKRKDMNADSLARTKAINAAAGIVTGLIETLEKRLLAAETFGERAAEARKGLLRSAREETLRALGADPSVYVNLGEQDEQTWASTLTIATEARDARVERAKQEEAVRIEAERIVAEKREVERKERIANEAARVEREKAQIAETDRVRKEQAEERAAADAERAKHEAEIAKAAKALADQEAQAKAERDAIEAKARAEREAAAEETRKAQAEVKRLEAVALAAATAERERAEAEVAALEAKLAAQVAVEAARVAAEADQRKPTAKKYAALVAALKSIAGNEDGEPCSAKAAREALESVGLGS